MPKAPLVEPITSYKGFDADWKCRDFQYALGETYTHVGEVKACGSGFHACDYPLDVFGYYPPASSRFAVVEQSGDLSREAGGDSKVASRTLKIGLSIDFAGLVKAAVEYTTSRCLPIDPASPASATGEQGAASATGEQGAASATGYRGAASATGEQGAARATGNWGAASATGNWGAASATGNWGAASATGYRGAASATGYRGAASATGEQGVASATGEQGVASATGEQGAASATGEQGAASATGEQGAASATGYQGAAMAAGRAGKAKGAAGCAIFLVFRDEGYTIQHAKAAIVGQNGIQPDTWYMLDAAGKFVEAAE
jgi:hypothetical protein